jgi:hypothetical protein
MTAKKDFIPARAYPPKACLLSCGEVIEFKPPTPKVGEIIWCVKHDKEELIVNKWTQPEKRRAH